VTSQGDLSSSSSVPCPLGYQGHIAASDATQVQQDPEVNRGILAQHYLSAQALSRGFHALCCWDPPPDLSPRPTLNFSTSRHKTFRRPMRAYAVLFCAFFGGICSIINHLFDVPGYMYTNTVWVKRDRNRRKETEDPRSRGRGPPTPFKKHHRRRDRPQ